MLFVVCCSLFVVCFRWLFTFVISCYWLLLVRCLLCVVCFSCAVCGVLIVARCAVFVAGVMVCVVC